MTTVSFLHGAPHAHKMALRDRLARALEMAEVESDSPIADDGGLYDTEAMRKIMLRLGADVHASSPQLAIVLNRHHDDS